IFAGPLANYLFASVFFFFAIYHGGVAQDGDKPGTTVISVTTGRELPAEKAGMKDGDRIMMINNKDVDT
ncbi:MAG: PDZ domain-containing protein, partial [Myxococcota bacterium]